MKKNVLILVLMFLLITVAGRAQDNKNKQEGKPANQPKTVIKKKEQKKSDSLNKTKVIKEKDINKQKARNLNSDTAKKKDNPKKPKSFVIDNNNYRVKDTVVDKIIERDKRKPVVREIEKDKKVNWTEQYIEVTGIAAIDTKRFPNQDIAELNALDAARIDAQKNLAEAIMGVKITGNTRVQDRTIIKNEIEGQMDTILKGSVFVGNYSVAGNKLTVTMRAPIYSEDGVAPVVVNGITKDKELSNDFKVKNANDKIVANDDNYFVIDVKGKNFDPALFPTIIDEQGNVIVDLTQIYSNLKNKDDFSKILQYLNLSKETLKVLGEQKGVKIIEAIEAGPGKIKVNNDGKNKLMKFLGSDTAKGIFNILKKLLIGF